MAVERHIVTENQARDFLGLPRTSPEWTPFFMGDTGYLGAIEMASRKCEEHIKSITLRNNVTDRLGVITAPSCRLRVVVSALTNNGDIADNNYTVFVEVSK